MTTIDDAEVLESLPAPHSLAEARTRAAQTRAAEDESGRDVQNFKEQYRTLAGQMRSLELRRRGAPDLATAQTLWHEQTIAHSRATTLRSALEKRQQQRHVLAREAMLAATAYREQCAKAKNLVAQLRLAQHQAEHAEPWYAAEGLAAIETTLTQLATIVGDDEAHALLDRQYRPAWLQEG